MVVIGLVPTAEICSWQEARGLPVHVNRASAALADPTAELRAVEFENVS